MGWGRILLEGPLALPENPLGLSFQAALKNRLAALPFIPDSTKTRGNLPGLDTAPKSLQTQTSENAEQFLLALKWLRRQLLKPY